MAIDQESFNKRLYDILKTRGYKPSPKDSKNERTNPETADVFEFQFIKDGENYGKAWATIDKTSSLNLYYDDNQAGSPPGQTKGMDYDDSWSGLLKHLKQWALSKQLNFGLHDSDRLGDDMRQRDYYKMKEKMTEGYHAVNKMTSYNDNIPNVKVVIQHDRQIGEGEQRWRNVHKIFVENTEGERFAVPTRMPGIARVYGRHVAEGGTPYDERGKHITQLVEEYTKMAGFIRATRRGEFNESVAQLIAEGVKHHRSIKETLQKMQSHRGYNHYFESWTPALMEDDADHTSIAEMFSQESIDPRIESVLPILNKLNSNIINEIEEVNELDQWAKSITEMEELDEEKENSSIEDDELRDEESGKNHDPKTGKRIRPHPFDPDDEHLEEGKHNKLVVDALEMSEKEFAEKHPTMAHRYDDILAAFSEEDLKDKIESPKQQELDLTENDDWRSLIHADIKQIQQASGNAKSYEEVIKQRIRDRKLQIPKESDPVKRKQLGSEIREYEKFKNQYDFNKASSAKNAKDASRIEADRILNKKSEPYTRPADKVTIGTALAGLLGEESVIDEKDFSDKEIKMAYGILNDPRYKGGNQTGAIKAIEGIKAGLSEHPGVKRAIYKTQNEPDNLEEGNYPIERIKSPTTGKEVEYSILNGEPFNIYGGPLGFDDYYDIMVAMNYPAEGPTITQMYSDYKDEHGEIPTSGYNPGHPIKEEEIDETKAGGFDFAGDYKTGQAGQWKNTGKTKGRPAKVGDLVGAESKHAHDEMSVSQMSDEDLADYLNVDVKDVKADRDHAEEVANDKSRDHAPDNMLEDILRLSGYEKYQS